MPNFVVGKGGESTFSKMAKITTQNSIFANFEADFPLENIDRSKNRGKVLAPHTKPSIFSQ